MVVPEDAETGVSDHSVCVCRSGPEERQRGLFEVSYEIRNVAQTFVHKQNPVQNLFYEIFRFVAKIRVNWKKLSAI